MNAGKFLQSVFALIVGDFLIYTLVQAFSTAIPGWAPYGWPLYLGYNGTVGAFIAKASKD